MWIEKEERERERSLEKKFAAFFRLHTLSLHAAISTPD